MTYKIDQNRFGRSQVTKTAFKGSYIKIRSLIKLKILITVVLLFSFWLLAYLDGVDNFSKPIYGFPRMGKDKIVDTPGCRILNFPIFHSKFLHLFANEPDPNILNCDPEKKGELVKATSTQLYINPEVIPNYTNETFTCCYQHFWRKIMRRNSKNEYPIKVDFDIRYNDECTPIIGITKVEKQFIRVICFTEFNLTLYEDYFTFAIDYQETKERVNRRQHLWTKKKPDFDQYSVLILGFDGMSRLNFLRQMPRTADFIEKQGGVVLEGYNKVGYNTFPNLVALLTGRTEQELQKICYPSKLSVLDSCPWIWKSFKRKGYYTALGEDSTLISTFSFHKRGFRRKPVDYYLKPYFYEAESRLSLKTREKTFTITCTGKKPNIVRFAEAFRGFVSNFKNKSSFGMFWLNGLSHDSLILARLGDKLFRSTLDSLKNEGALNRTVLIVISDHGMRWGPFRETYQGYFEERLPLAAILLPDNFKRRFTQFETNLRENANRLTSPFDIHETLKDILHVETRMKSVKDDSNRYRGLSLFRKISPTRTCFEADISSEWCACFNGLMPQHPNEPFSLKLGRTVVSYINHMVRNSSQCLPLTMRKVRSIWSEIPRESDLFENPLVFVISLETVPGDAIFEARLEYEKPDQVSIVGTISRLNPYGNNSTCVPNSSLRLYCFCGTSYKKDEVDEMPYEQYALMKAALTSPPETGNEEAESSKYLVEANSLKKTEN